LASLMPDCAEAPAPKKKAYLWELWGLFESTIACISSFSVILFASSVILFASIIDLYKLVLILLYSIGLKNKK
jgi:hypothetical protein